MALLFVDPFENGATGVNLNASPNSRLFDMLTTGENGSYVRIVAGTLSSKCALVHVYRGYRSWFRPLNRVFSNEKITVGFAYSLSAGSNNVPSGYTPTASAIPVSFSGSSTPDTVSARMSVNPDWSLTLGDLTSAPGLLVDSVYAYIEVELDFQTGEFTLWVNNASVGTGTMAFSGDKIILLGCPRDQYWYVYTNYQFFDDIYILDDTGTTHNQRLGPVRAVRVPFNSTTEANFTPFGAADNITAINKDSPNTSTFNRSPAANNVGDYFKLDTSTMPSDRPIIAVQQSAMYRKTDIGERALKLVAKEGVDRKEHPLPDRLVTFSGGPAQILETAADGSAWDLTNLAATDFGYEVTE